MDSRARAIAVVVGCVAAGRWCRRSPRCSASPSTSTSCGAIMIFAIAAVSLEPDPRLRRHGAASATPPTSASAPTRSASSRFYGIHNGWLQWALAIGASALVALADRRGLAAHQRHLLHHDHARLHADAVLPRHLDRPSTAATTACGSRGAASSPALIDLDNPTSSTTSCWRCSSLLLWLGHRLVNSRFGAGAPRGAARTSRARAPSASRPIRYRLAAFVIAGAMCGLAGALLANQTDYLTPEFMNWTRSGELMFMVILGGMGTAVRARARRRRAAAARGRARPRWTGALAGRPRADPRPGRAVCSRRGLAGLLPGGERRDD